MAVVINSHRQVALQSLANRASNDSVKGKEAAERSQTIFPLQYYYFASKVHTTCSHEMWMCSASVSVCASSVCVSLCARMRAVIVYECVRSMPNYCPPLFQSGESRGRKRTLAPQSSPQLAEGDKTNRLPRQDAAE